MSNNGNTKRKKKKRLNVKAIGTSVAVLFLVLFVPIYVSNSGYKGLMKDYCKSINRQDYELYKSTFPSFVTDNGLESLMCFAYDSGQSYVESLYVGYTERYGKKTKLSCKVLDRTKLSKDELKEYSEDATAYCTDGSEINLKKGYRLNVSLTYKGKDGSDTEELSVVVVKYDGNWYIYDGDIYFC